MSTLSEQKLTLITKLEALPKDVWEDADTGPFLVRTVKSLYADIAAQAPLQVSTQTLFPSLERRCEGHEYPSQLLRCGRSSEQVLQWVGDTIQELNRAHEALLDLLEVEDGMMEVSFSYEAKPLLSADLDVPESLWDAEIPLEALWPSAPKSWGEGDGKGSFNPHWMIEDDSEYKGEGYSDTNAYPTLVVGSVCDFAGKRSKAALDPKE